MKELLKAKALEIAEKHLVQAVDDVYAIAEVVVDSTDNSLDDALLEGLKLLKGEILKQVDKIDGEQSL